MTYPTSHPSLPSRLVAFSDGQKLADGGIPSVAASLRRHLDDDPKASILVFDAETSRPFELDLQGDANAVTRRYASLEALPDAPKRPGRPKLGVVGREVTLLPRHWEWLAAQPGGASVTLRKLVEQARRDGSGGDARRRAQDATYRFMLGVAGDREGYEEALRALYAGRRDDFMRLVGAWPADVRDHVVQLAMPAFDSEPKPS